MELTGLKGKVAIVNGASSGLGQAQAIHLAKEGVKVIAIGRNEQGLQHTIDTIAANGGQAEAMVANVTDEKRLTEIVEDVIKRYKSIDIVCNTAGIYDQHKKTLEIDKAYFCEVLETNVVSMYIMCRLVIPYMLEQGGGVILNMSSFTGKRAGGGGSAYVTSKHAICGYTKSLCFEYAAQGIRANAICPGSVATPLIEQSIDPKDDWRLNLIPCRRYGTADDVAYLTVFLASEQASWIHGADISIDGGRNAKG